MASDVSLGMYTQTYQHPSFPDYDVRSYRFVFPKENSVWDAEDNAATAHSSLTSLESNEVQTTKLVIDAGKRVQVFATPMFVRVRPLTLIAIVE